MHRWSCILVLAGCASESGGGGPPPGSEPEDWYAHLASAEPLIFDTTTTTTITLEASINLTRSARTFGPETAVTGFSVIAELPMRGGIIDMALAIEGEDPGLHGTGTARGPYTYGHGDVVVLRPLASCTKGPCSAKERYTLRLATKELDAGPVELKWDANLHVMLHWPGIGDPPPYEDEGESVEIVVVPPAAERR